VSLAVVRVRGTVNINEDIRDALRMLHLTRANHCTIVPEDAQWRGTLLKVKDYVTWGRVDEKTVHELLQKRGRLEGGKALTDAFLSKTSAFKSTQELARALAAQQADLRRLKGVKPLFRLAPPRKGYEKVTRDFRSGGTLGDRGEKINELIRRML
jgi:large subunit ribosomal protein L30